MPYTKEQLANNEYFQNLKLQASKEYEEEKARMTAEFAASSSLDDNNQLLRQGPGGPILSYEDPETGNAQDDPTGWIKIDRKQPKLKRGDGLEEVIDRNFNELI
tara:strand:+ start:6195 stop:6506 length:312 start_codon:yes stop_codon:yes gene_type:complete